MKNKTGILLTETGVSYNKHRLHTAGYSRELLSTNSDIIEGLRLSRATGLVIFASLLDCLCLVSKLSGIRSEHSSNAQNRDRYCANDSVAMGPQVTAIRVAASNEQIRSRLLRSLAENLWHITTADEYICLDS